MATTGRRLVLDGRPSIPMALDLAATRAAVDQIRTRLDKIDAAVNRAFNTLDASSPQDTLEALQAQIVGLQKALEKLTQQVTAATTARQPTTYLAMQMGDDGEDGLAGPPGPPGPTGPPGPMAAQGCDDCGGDEYTIVLQQVTGTSSPGGDSFLWDEEGRALLTEDGEAILLG